MSMSMHVLAVKPADENYKRKAEAYRACKAARIPIPAELEEFFDGGEPDPTGVTQHLGHGYTKPSELHPSVAKYKAEMEEGFEVDITKLPEGTRFVRFYCSW